MSDNPQADIEIQTLKRAADSVSRGQLSGAGRLIALAGTIFRRLDNNTKLFLAFGFACLGVLAYSAKVNHEPIATGVGIVAVAVFGGSAWKNHADQAYKNGNGGGGNGS